MLARLILLFTIVPILELALLIQTGRWIGLWPTLGLVISTGIIGAALASREGLRAWRSVQRDLWEGRVPTRSVLDGLSVFVGGALLLTPGLMTDALGFALLLRPTRRWAQDRVIKRIGGAVMEHGRVRFGTTVDWGASARSSEGEAESERPDRGRPAGREIDASQDD